jgi:hypothetical protein
MSSALSGAGIGAVLVTAGTAVLRGLGTYVTDGADALEMGLHRAPTLWALAASLAAGGVTGALAGLGAGRPSAPEPWGRATVILTLLLILSGAMYFAIWEGQILYVLPSMF